MVRSPSDAVAAGEAGAVEAVVAALRGLGVADAELDALELSTLRVNALKVLASLCFSKDNKSKASRAGALELLLAMAPGLAVLPNVQPLCLLVVGNMASEAAFSAAAFSAGALPLAVAAMRANPTHAELQTAALIVLGNIGREHAVGTAAFEALLAAARTHHADAKVVQELCRAISNCTLVSINVREAVRAGAVATLVVAMREHATDTVVQEDLCYALGSMADPASLEELRARVVRMLWRL
jgi:hypothetical protein